MSCYTWTKSAKHAFANRRFAGCQTWSDNSRGFSERTVDVEVSE